MVDFSSIKSIEIPEGKVKSITRNGTILWKASQLPSEYQQVEWIKSTGTQYLDSGISCANGIKCQYKALFNSYGYLCGAHGLSNPYGRCGSYVHSDKKWEFGYGNTYNKAGTADLNILYEVEYKTTYNDAYLKVKGGIYDDWTQIYTASSQTVSTLNAMIFSQQYAITYGEPKTQAVLYYLKIYDSNDVLQGDFVPCYRKSDDEVGLYNLVNDTFITNLGTGTLEKGGDV